MNETPSLGRFYNREPLLELYEHSLHNIPKGLKILNIHGMGGIGKSRLITEMSRRTSPKDYLKARIDLESRYLRRQNDALAVLRYGLVKQGVRFDRFDIAQAVIWQHDHPLQSISRERFSMVENSKVLTEIMDNASGTPVFGAAVQLVSLCGKVMSDRRRRSIIRSDPILLMFDEMPPRDRQDALIKLFTRDLKDFESDKELVLFVDGYDELVHDPQPWVTVAQEAAWLRDLLRGLDPVLAVVASRDPLRWDSYGDPWQRVIRHEHVGSLSMSDSDSLLAERQVEDVECRGRLAEAAGGVPLYLHVAADLELQAPGSGERVRDSSEIYRRLFSFSTDEEMRLLQILSIAEIFDAAMYAWILRAFPRLDGVIEWEDLVQRQSLVVPLEHEGWYRLHPLVPGGLKDRLGGASFRHVHLILRDFWQQRYKTGEHDDIWSSVALRVFRHALRAGVSRPHEIEILVEQSIAQGGAAALEELLVDMRAYVPRPPLTREYEQMLKTLELWLDLELRLLWQSAAEAAEVTRGLTFQPRDSLAQRHALAAAHARRIAGETASALSAYEAVWRSSQRDAPRKPRAGFCLADIRMWQGNYKGSMDLIEETFKECEPHHALLEADLHRLRALGFRFLYQLPEAEEHLRKAEQAYDDIGAASGLAHMKTNRVELLVLTDPQQAVDRAPAALMAHGLTGLVREVGKVHTAVALAQVRLGRLDDAEESLEQADLALDRASYRSGKARNLLARAFVQTGRGDCTSAINSLRTVAAEFMATEVYPDLILLTGHAVRRLGAVPEDILQAEAWARTRFHPVQDFAVWDEETAKFVAKMMSQE